MQELGAVRVQPSDPHRMLWEEAPKTEILKDHIQQGAGDGGVGGGKGCQGP